MQRGGKRNVVDTDFIDNIRWNGRIESKKEENYGHVAIPQLTIAAI